MWSPLSAPTPMIQAEHLIFDYPCHRALDDVSFTIAPQTITALVGPNGAGKTTLLRCLVALDRPGAGRVLLDELDVHEAPREAHKRMAFLPDFFGVYDDLTVRQCLSYRARAHDVPRERRRAAVERAAERLGIADRMRDYAGTLSRGLKQRLAIAQAIIHEPRIALLDEPAAGLDPEARYSLAAVFRELRNDGMTLIVSSHILAELEDYSTHLLAIRDGRIVDLRALQQLDTGESPVPMQLRLAMPDPRIGPLLAGVAGVSDLAVDTQIVRFSLVGGPPAHHALLKRLIDEGLPIAEFAPVQSSLQDSYIALMRKQAAS
jgi:ABC-2 type transport system ATP-binding protein